MREHPIPQDITGYQFHIIGEMTIKQFGEVLLGVLMAVLLYASNLPMIIKWPLIGISLGIGGMMAFVPFEERPLDHWIITFIRVLYKPTKYFWRREPRIPEPFLFEPSAEVTQSRLEVDLTPARRERIKEYLQSVNQMENWDVADPNQEYLNYILGMFNEMPGSHQANLGGATKPQLTVRVRSLREEVTEEAAATDMVQPVSTPDQPEVQRAPLTYRNPLATNQVAQDIAVPEIDHVSLAQTVDVEESEKQHLESPDERAYTDTQAAPEEITTSQAAAFNVDLPFPDAPSIPNKLVGMVLTPHHELISDAIVEIQDAQGRTVRAVKTNALGQFFISTPLESGQYFITTEKDGFAFQPIQLTLEDKVVHPLEIRSVV